MNTGPTESDPDWTPQPNFSKRFWVGCAILFLAAIFATIMLVTANDARRLNANNVQTTATVLDTRFISPKSARDGDGAHYLTYTFTWSGDTITNERDVPKDIYDTHPVGHTWAIRIHPDAPRIHDLYASQTRNAAWGHLMVSVFIALGGIVLGLSNGNLAALRARLR